MTSYARSNFAPRPVTATQYHHFDFITKFEVGHGFVLGTGAGTTVTEEIGSPFGSDSTVIKFTRETTGNSTPLWKSNLSIDLTDKMLVVWVRRTTDTGALNVYAGDNALSSYYYWNAGRTTPRTGSGGWDYYVLPMSNAGVTGSITPTTVTRLHFTGNVGADLAPVYLGGIALTPTSRRYPNGVVSITFDDSLDNAFGIAKPIMDTFGYGGTGYFLPYTLGGAGVPTLAELHAMEDTSGWEIAGHSFTQHTDMTTLTPTQLEVEVTGLRGWLMDNGFRGHHHLAYPFGAHNATVRAAVGAAGFKTARTVTNGERVALPPEPARLLQLNAFTWGAGYTTVQAVTDRLDRAKAGKGWAVLLFHTLGDAGGDEVSVTDFTAILEHIDSIGMAVAPVGDVMGTWR